MPDDMRHYAVSDTAGQPPFTPGDSVVFRHHPLFEPMTVARCYWRYGYWIVDWVAGSAAGFTPANHLVLCPAGYTPPPPPPTTIALVDGRYEPVMDKEASLQWEQQMKAWMRGELP